MPSRRSGPPPRSGPPRRGAKPAGSRPPGSEAEETSRAPSAPSALSVAVSLVPGIDADHPADAVMREYFRTSSRVDRNTASEVARLVFAYFRWRGLVARGLPLSRQVETAASLALRFAREPEGFTDLELRKAVPSWVADPVSAKAAWYRAIQMEPRLWLRARPGTAPAVSAALEGANIPYPELFPDALEYVGERDLFRTAEFQAGQFELQDLGSQAVGVACQPRPGEAWWDACAGEGGKTLHLADLMGNKGVVWGTDRAGWRLQRLRMRAGRAGLFNIRWGEWDGGPARPMRERMDGVLVDAPCTGIGTWQRNPHARWTLRPESIGELSAIQLGLLRHASAAVKPGGRLVYAVCTLTRAETTEVARAFLASAEGAAFEPVALSLPWVRGDRVGEDCAWLWPQDLGSNGMFLAAWRRKAG